mmetsp:Transcript_37916/g.55604  ORF Transcript_37916/g.55604 Transcript_37916/m.55604 type:complete len:87 (-) Transcript_37916:491-751(-)
MPRFNCISQIFPTGSVITMAYLEGAFAASQHHPSCHQLSAILKSFTQPKCFRTFQVLIPFECELKNTSCDLLKGVSLHGFSARNCE